MVDLHYFCFAHTDKPKNMVIAVKLDKKVSLFHALYVASIRQTLKEVFLQ